MRLIDAGDVVTSAHYDEQEDTLVIKQTQDVEPILDANKADYDVDDRRYLRRDLYRVASIPVTIVEKWLREEGVNVFDPNHKPAIRRLLNSNEYAYLRTKPGRI